MLSIALVHPFSWPEVRRGGERYVNELASWLAGRGHEVEILTGTAGVSKDETRPDGVVVRRRTHLRRFRMARVGVTDVESFGAAIFPTLIGRRYDVVHAMTPTAALAARATGQRTIYTVLGHPTPDQLGGRRFDRRLFSMAAHAANEVTALSVASADQVAALFGCAARVLPPGIHIHNFPPNLAPRTPPPRILFSGAYDDPRKGLDRAFSVMATLLRSHPDARLLLSGQGSRVWAQDLLGPTTLKRICEITDDLGSGSTEEVPGRYRSATLTLLPATQEAFGLVLVESLASGTPVVCTADGGMPEIVSTPRVGRTAALHDLEALCTAVEETVQVAYDPETPGRCVEHARRWDWSTVVGPAHEALYADVAERCGRVIRPNWLG